MPGFEEKPTTEHIKQQVKYLEDVWRDTHQLWEMCDAYYDRTFEIWDPKSKRPRIHPATPRSLIDTAVAQMMGHEPTFERFPRDLSRKDDADTGEKALAAIFRQKELLETDAPTETLKKHMMLYGYAILEDDIDSTDLNFHEQSAPVQENGEDNETFQRRKAFYEHRKKSLMPFRSRAPHPADVLIDPSHKNPRIAIKTAKWYAGDLYELSKKKDESAKRGFLGRIANVFKADDNPFRLVKAFDYWTESWHALLAENDEMILIEPNTWGFVKFSHGFAGFGHMPTNADDRNVKYLAVGMLNPIFDALKVDAQLASGRANAAMEAMFVKRGTTEEPEDVANQEATSDILHLNNKGSLWMLEQPNLPPWLRGVGAENDDDIARATFPPSLGGIRDEGVNTVGQAAINHTSGQRKFIAPTKQIDQMVTKSAEHILQWIDILDLDLTIEGNHINRSIIDGDYSVKAQLKVIDPVLQLQERRQALTEYQAGVMDLQTFWAVSGRSDATGSRKKQWEDMVYAHPVIQEQFVKQIAKQLGLEKLMSEEPDQHAAPAQANTPRSEILGPDGQPLDSTLGTGTLRAPLTPDIAKPPQTGANLAG